MAKKYIIEGVDYGRDLGAYLPSAPNFQYWEFVSSINAVRAGIANIPTESEWKNIEAYAKDILQPLRNIVGRIDISSGFRNEEVNNLAKSTNRSFHRLGMACDLEPLDVPLMKLLEEAMKMNVTEVIAEFFPHGWVHVGYQIGRPERKLKLKDNTHNFTVLTLKALKAIYPN